MDTEHPRMGGPGYYWYWDGKAWQPVEVEYESPYVSSPDGGVLGTKCLDLRVYFLGQDSSIRLGHLETYPNPNNWLPLSYPVV